MKCFDCGGKMDQVTTSIETGWGDYNITINGVKAHLCEECGQKVYDPEEVKMIQDIAQGFAERKETERPDILNVDEVADLLRVSTQTVYNMIKDGRLPAFKAGREWRFSKKELEKIMKNSSGYAVATRGELPPEDREVLAELLKQKGE